MLPSGISRLPILNTSWNSFTAFIFPISIDSVFSILFSLVFSVIRLGVFQAFLVLIIQGLDDIGSHIQAVVNTQSTFSPGVEREYAGIVIGLAERFEK